MPATLGVITACLVSLLLGRAAIAAAGRLRFLDAPGERKLQSRPIPVLGGAAIVLGLLAGLTLTWPDAERGLLLRWLAGSLWLLVVGMLDDRRGLGPRRRLLGQLLAALLLLPELRGWLDPGGLAVALGLVWVLGLVNAMNFLDNMDGAAGTLALTGAVALALSFGVAGVPALAAPLWPLAGALAGFLWWNRPSARLYMGDAGATVLGYTLALFSLLLVPRAGLSPWLLPFVVALPLYDSCTVFWIRWREGRPLWVGDRRHATHRLLDRGSGIGRALAVLNGAGRPTARRGGGASRGRPRRRSRRPGARRTPRRNPPRPPTAPRSRPRRPRCGPHPGRRGTRRPRGCPFRRTRRR
ncbi:MAG: undecaprenyl/decaprenyl-phosphate alpha-N-acetylglucosaminyl 1-phosphate transferase [Candidatus Latescibacteria bacterium]|nr:undecaprenyl/decaprenyl-phosphate alpha-N-acetylglucosaminyl 1-phosphate transferase [Candidatus Latescibacterota bacterium]